MQLRELIDIAWLEDFASGLARSALLRVCVYDNDGRLIVASAANNQFAQLTGHVLDQLPPNLKLERVPAHDPPAAISYVQSRGVWYIVAPVHADEHCVGYVGVGEFRATPPADDVWRTAGGPAGPALEQLRELWSQLPLLDRSGMSHPTVTVRWGARLLAAWVRRETRLLAAADEAALIGDIADLLTGQQDLQTTLDRIVRQTAQVMQCPACTLRLYDAQTNELTVQAVYNLPTEIVGAPALVRTVNEVDSEALKGNVIYIEDARQDSRVEDPEHAKRRGVVSVLTAGMVYRGTPVGVLRVYTSERRRFRQAQRNLLRSVAQQAAAAVMHARLIEERLRAANTERQLALAGELQKRFVSTPPPKLPRLKTAVIFEPTYHVAGDFCDFLTLCDGRVLAVVADVAGKGVPASLLMATARGALRAMADGCGGPAQMVQRLNRLMLRDTLPNEFITLLGLAIDPEVRKLTYCNAGHEPPLLLRNGELIAPDDADLVLGVSPMEVYHEHELELQPNDLVVMYTDGACEARNFADEEFGRARLYDALRAYGTNPDPYQVIKNIRWDIRRFVGLAEQSDDLTLVALRVAPE